MQNYKSQTKATEQSWMGEVN